MEKVLWSVDDQKYEEREARALILDGWYVSPSQKEYEFVLFCDTKKEIRLPEPKRYPRPDVARELKEIPGIKEPGFTAVIANAMDLADQYNILELFLVSGEDKISIWKTTGKDLREFCEDRLMEYHIDQEQILYRTTLAVEGWILNYRGLEEIQAEDSYGRPLTFQITRCRRPDVLECRQLEDCFGDREIGFRLLVNLEHLKGRKVVLRFLGEEREKYYTVDVKKLKADTTVIGRKMKLLSWEHKDENFAYIKEKGIGEFLKYVTDQAETKSGDYEEWLARHSAGKRELHRQKKAAFPNAPLISIVIPLYKTPIPYFKELLASIERQTYSNWQLCLADGSEGNELREYLRKHYRREKRISYKKLKENRGISKNTNAAIEMARGEYILFCDHDDVVAPDALYEIVAAIHKDPSADVIYTDEDKISMDGKHYFEPNFKPDFNLFRLQENNYICHIFVVKKALLDQVGYLRSPFDGAQDFDLIFRCCEKAEKIVHVPKVLYHWRCHMESTAADPSSKLYAYEAGRKAIEEHYKRTGVDARVESTEIPGWYRSHLKMEGNPLISIIIPNKDHVEDLELCLSSIQKKSTYPSYEILVVENNSENQETFAYYEELPKKYPKARVLTWTKEFNYAAINNYAAKQARGEYLLFLNNDVEIITPGWMEEMLGICQQKSVGIVGAKLYYPDDTIQHAGVVVGLGGIAGHIMCRALRSDIGYMGRMISVQEITAVTAACMLVKTQVFWKVEGFDEAFQVAFNDIDLCMKVRELGKLVVFTPHAELYHYESKSRGGEDTPEKQKRFTREVNRFEVKWARELALGDPYYSPNLSLTEGDCSLREN